MLDPHCKVVDFDLKSTNASWTIRTQTQTSTPQSSFNWKLVPYTQSTPCLVNWSPARNSRPSLTIVGQRFAYSETNRANGSIAAPATKVPGLVFCAGQTATGEIKQATVFTITFRPKLAHRTNTLVSVRSSKISKKSLSSQALLSTRLSNTTSTLRTWKTLQRWTRHTSISYRNQCLQGPVSRL